MDYMNPIDLKLNRLFALSNVKTITLSFENGESIALTIQDFNDFRPDCLAAKEKIEKILNWRYSIF